jgi:hypothetical protein
LLSLARPASAHFATKALAILVLQAVVFHKLADARGLACAALAVAACGGSTPGTPPISVDLQTAAEEMATAVAGRL